MESILELSDGKQLSYRFNNGSKGPTVVFMHGSLSDKNGAKSLMLEKLCEENDVPFVAFDFTGHGESSGEYTDGTIGIWFKDALDIIDRVVVGDVILVGSSLGGWISLLTAQALPERVKAVIGLAAAADFTKDVWASFSVEQKQEVLDKGVLYIPNGWTEQGDPWTKRLFSDAEHFYVLNGEGSLNIDCPVVLIHGKKDDCVSFKKSFEIMDCLKTDNCKVIVLKNSGHRLVDECDLAVLKQELITLLNKSE